MFEEMKDLLYQTCIVSRTTETLVKPTNRPTKTTVVTGTYSCLVSRKSPGYVIQDGTAATLNMIQLRAYMAVDCDIKKGDLLECEGTKYRVGLIYKPMNDHIEADLTILGDEL